MARRKLEPEGYIGSIKIGGEIRLIDGDTYLPRHKKQALLKAERYREAGHKAKVVPYSWMESGRYPTTGYAIAFRHKDAQKNLPSNKAYRAAERGLI